MKRYLLGNDLLENDDWELNAMGDVPNYDSYDSDDNLYEFVQSFCFEQS